MIYHETEWGTLYHGDCITAMKQMPNKLADSIVTDPPYGLTGCKWDTDIDLNELWTAIKAIRKSNAPILMTSMQPFTTDLINSNRKEFRFAWVWNKHSASNIFNLKHYPLRIHEDILLFCESGGFMFNPQRESRTELSLKRDPGGKSSLRASKPTKMEHYGSYNQGLHIVASDGMKNPTSIIDVAKNEGRNTGITHPTKKPVNLFSYLINTYSDTDNTILDPFAGSGTTAIACIKNSRKYIIMEKDERYCEVAAKRIEKEIEQTRIAV